MVGCYTNLAYNMHELWNCAEMSVKYVLHHQNNKFITII